MATAALAAGLSFATGSASAAGPPLLGAAWASDVVATSARLHGAVNPNGLPTTYRFEYIPATTFEANQAQGKDGFAGAAKVPSGTSPSAGAGTAPLAVSQPVAGLAAATAYRYRLVAVNGAGTSTGPALRFATHSFAGGPTLLDGRSWEMVSPVDKNGGQVDAPEALAAGGVLQAAADGRSVTYSSAASFGAAPSGAPLASQYVARRGAAGWANENVTTPALSGSYGTEPLGVPYQLFSPDLARGLLLNGRHCRDGGEGCPVANPPLPGSGAPAGYQNYYLRQSAPVGFQALLDAGDLAITSLDAARFGVTLAGAAPDLRHVVLSTCAALTPDAVEVALGEGCDPAATNLYLWSNGSLSLVNVLPGEAQGAVGASLAAQAGAVSADGARVYWRLGDELYLSEGGESKLVDAAVDAFQTAAADGSVAFFTKEAHLYRYDAAGGSAADLTPAGGVEGVLGAAANGARVYYLTGAGLFLHDGGEPVEVAADAHPSSYPPATGAARVSADGTSLAFLSAESLTGYDNLEQGTGQPVTEVYLYDAVHDRLVCASCNPTGARPLGPSGLPGARANGSAPGSLRSYRPRAMSSAGSRLFFESEDALVLGDTNGRTDVYEWEAQGTGGCTTSGGCLGLISSGRGTADAVFADASPSGNDAFFLTARSLVGADPGSVDLYDARVGGGFPEAAIPIPCAGDACQSLPPPPVDPAVGSLVAGPGNPAVRYRRLRQRKRRAAKQKRRRQRAARRRAAARR